MFRSSSERRFWKIPTSNVHLKTRTSIHLKAGKGVKRKKLTPISWGKKYQQTADLTGRAASGTTALRTLMASYLLCALSSPGLSTTAQDGFPKVFSNQTLKVKGPRTCRQGGSWETPSHSAVRLRENHPPETQAVMAAIEKKTERRPSLWGLWQGIKNRNKV